MPVTGVDRRPDRCRSTWSLQGSRRAGGGATTAGAPRGWAGVCTCMCRHRAPQCTPGTRPGLPARHVPHVRARCARRRPLASSPGEGRGPALEVGLRRCAVCTPDLADLDFELVGANQARPDQGGLPILAVLDHCTMSGVGRGGSPGCAGLGGHGTNSRRSMAPAYNARDECAPAVAIICAICTILLVGDRLTTLLAAVSVPAVTDAAGSGTRRGRDA